MNRKGVTLIELLVALVVSGVLLAGVYRTFVSQQHTFSVQDQVVDMQQNVRLAINRMTRELRMAGFGGGGVSGWVTFFSHGGMKVSGGKTFNNVVTPGAGGKSVTVVEAYQALATLSAPASSGTNSISVNDASGFDSGVKGYISINGVESHHISAIAGTNIQFPGWDNLANDHQIGEKIYLVQAITYSIGPFEGKSCLLRDDNLGAGPQPVAENVESVQFRNPDGSIPLNPNSACMQVAVTAITDMPDPDLAKVGDGLRRRTLTSNIQLRNLSF
jgi:type IV pilus assembly protein PilW